MADKDQLEIIRRSVKDWNYWREYNPESKVDLIGASLNEADLNGANLNKADLYGASLNEAVKALFLNMNIVTYPTDYSSIYFVSNRY